MIYGTNFSTLSKDEMMEVDGGGITAAGVWAVVKAGTAIVGVGVGGVIVGAGVILGTYYTCKAIFG